MSSRVADGTREADGSGRVLDPGGLALAASLATAAVVWSPAGATLLGSSALVAAGGLLLARAADGRQPRLRDVFRLGALGVFALAINAAFTRGSPLVVWGRTIPVSAEGVRVGSETGLRLVALVLLFQGAARAFSPFEAVGHLERVLAPLRRLGVRADGLSVVLLVALRLAPGLGAEARRLTLQRALRGPWPGPAAPVRERRRRLALRLRDVPAVLVPLTLLVLRRAEELAWALPARYYGLGPRTPARLRPWGGREWSAVAAGALLLGGVAWSRSCR